MKFHPKQQYTILFQWNFISEVYLLQEKSYLTFYTGQNFWRALYIQYGMKRGLAHGHAAWTCSRTSSRDRQRGQAAWKCSMDMQLGTAATTCGIDAARTCSMDIQHGRRGFQFKDMPHGQARIWHAAWTLACSSDIQHEPAARTCSTNTQHRNGPHADSTDMQHEQAALTSSRDIQHRHVA
jgi:hypothetical protein